MKESARVRQGEVRAGGEVLAQVKEERLQEGGAGDQKRETLAKEEQEKRGRYYITLQDMCRRRRRRRGDVDVDLRVRIHVDADKIQAGTSIEKKRGLANNVRTQLNVRQSSAKKKKGPATLHRAQMITATCFGNSTQPLEASNPGTYLRTTFTFDFMNPRRDVI